MTVLEKDELLIDGINKLYHVYCQHIDTIAQHRFNDRKKNLYNSPSYAFNVFFILL